MTDKVVAVRGLRMAYGKVVVLDGVDLAVAAGEILAVTGVNGAGKSTLLSCLAGLRRQSAGTVSVLGGPPRDTPEFWRSVALVAEQPSWYPGLTVREHVELVRLTHQSAGDWWVTADELIEAFGLTARADAMPSELSSGQRQRLSLAVALARPSRLLLLDEPEQSLDAGFRLELAGLLRDGYAAHGGAVVMATHDPAFAAAAGARQFAMADSWGRGAADAGSDGAAGDRAACDGATGDNAAGDRADGDHAACDGAVGATGVTGATGDNAAGDHAACDSAAGDRAACDHAACDSAAGDRAACDGAAGDGAGEPGIAAAVTRIETAQSG